MTIHHAFKAIVNSITKLTLQITSFLGKLRLTGVMWLFKVILLINIEAEIQIQVHLIPKTGSL